MLLGTGASLFGDLLTGEGTNFEMQKYYQINLKVFIQEIIYLK